MQSQCLNRRIPDLTTMCAEVVAWEPARNNRGAPINWQFTNEIARIKLTRLYPNLGASGFRVGRVARAGGHEVKPTEMKEDGAPEASTVAEAASHGFDLLDASIE